MVFGVKEPGPTLTRSTICDPWHLRALSINGN